MSVKIMSMVWDSPVFRCNTKLIMLCLADFANDEGYCWPSLERLSKKCGISRSTLKSQLANLCNDGFIRKELRKKVTASGELTNDTNVYWIMLNKLGGSESDLGQNSPQSNSGLGRNSSKGGPKSDPKPSIDPSDLIDPPIVPQTAAKQNRKKNHKAVSMPEALLSKPTWRSGTPNNPSSRWTWKPPPLSGEMPCCRSNASTSIGPPLGETECATPTSGHWNGEAVSRAE